ncbi:helicase-associated domain-containing protein [Paenibacillus sp. S28]|uniref:helicase-associated domain-containing protein n=1 Tax=Paenibacillus sp. S28 TaxID=2767463 RepID=UPI00190BD8C7|nr:helicase-associated domain-containing protein [Paenibacillus sp. S28]MBJ9988287.1 helicase-associated domain-containing protein [Paenibacillus sp. S28]
MSTEMNEDSPQEFAIRSILRTLAPEDAELLKRLIVRFAGQPFSDDARTTVKSSGRSGAELELSFIRLRRAGLIQAVKKVWGEKLYYIPLESLGLLYRQFFTPEAEVVPDSNVHRISEAKPGLALDLLHALAAAAEHGLPLTAKGTVHKKNIQKLLEAVHLKDSDLETLQLQYAHAETYPLVAAVLLDIMMCLGLAVKESQGIVLEEERLGEWLNLSEQEMNRVLLLAVLDRYGINSPALQHFRYLLCHPSFQPGVWYDMTNMLDWMEQEVLLTRSVSEAGVRAWMTAMAGFGWGDTGEDGSGRCCFRWAIDPAFVLVSGGEDREMAGEGRFYVQPDFDVIVPPDVPYRIRWKLLACSERVQSERMSIYRLTRSSTARAVENGMSAAEMTQLLDNFSGGGVPENVRLALEQWGREIGRTRFEEAMLLSCSAEEDGDRIEAHPKLKGHLQRIGPKHFLVNSGAVPEVRKILDSSGLSPLKAIAEPGRTVSTYPLIHDPTPDLTGQRIDVENFRQTGLSAAGGLVYSGRNIQYFEPDSDIPKPESLFPGYGQVPKMWTQDFRNYHGTTAQHIMEQALEWQTKVLISRGGSRLEFIPRGIRSHPWAVEGTLFDPERDGYEDGALLSQGDWEQIRLIVPSFT